MNRARLYAFALASALAATLAACGGGGHGSSPLPGGGVPQTGFVDDSASIPLALQIPQWGRDVLTGATYVGPLTNGHLSVNVLVHQQNSQGLIAYAQQANDPSSANFRHWLTPQQIGQQFGASSSDYSKAASYFVAQGLGVGAWPQHMLLTVSGSQNAMQRAFGVQFGIFQRDGVAFVSPMSVPHFTTPLPVDAVGQLVSYNRTHTYLMQPPRAGNGVLAGYSPQQVQAAFDLTGAIKSGYNGAGVTIGIIGTGPINTVLPAPNACNTGGSTNNPGDQDLNGLKSIYNMPIANVYEQCVTASGVAAGLVISGIPTASPQPSPIPTGMPSTLPNGFYYSSAFASPPPVATAPCTGALPTCNPEDGEAQLDLQQAASLAPGAIVDFYLAYNAADCVTYFPNSCPSTGSNAGAPAIGLAEADPEIQQVIADNKADVISMSYGGGETQSFTGLSAYNTSFYHLEFAALAAEGIAAFASSGDNGSAECLAQGNGYLDEVCVSYPSGDPFVTSVGGVTAYLGQFGQIQGPVLGWGISTFASGYGATGASGGGTSTFMPAPSWQTKAIAGAPTLREQPDVSMIGDPSTGVTFYTNGTAGGYPSGPSDIGGTSVASPEMAAVWALVLSACAQHPGAGMCPVSGHRLGVAAPYLYAIYACASTPCSAFSWSTSPSTGSVTPNLAYGSTFYDVLYGSNQMQNPGTVAASPIPGASAMPGYDQLTGVGVPFVGHLIESITGVSVP